MEKEYWGYHLILDVKGCHLPCARNPDYIRTFVADLVDAIDMEAYGDTQIVHFGKPEENKSGWTFVQLITTSTMMGHFLDHNGDAYIDVFSCKPFDPEIVKEKLQVYFWPENIKVDFKQRQA